MPVMGNWPASGAGAEPSAAVWDGGVSLRGVESVLDDGASGVVVAGSEETSAGIGAAGALDNDGADESVAGSEAGGFDGGGAGAATCGCAAMLAAGGGVGGGLDCG